MPVQRWRCGTGGTGGRCRRRRTRRRPARGAARDGDEDRARQGRGPQRGPADGSRDCDPAGPVHPAARWHDSHLARYASPPRPAWPGWPGWPGGNLSATRPVAAEHSPVPNTPNAINRVAISVHAHVSARNCLIRTPPGSQECRAHRRTQLDHKVDASAVDRRCEPCAIWMGLLTEARTSRSAALITHMA